MEARRLPRQGGGLECSSSLADPALEDKLLRLPAGRDARARDDLLEAFLHQVAVGSRRIVSSLNCASVTSPVP